MIFTDWSQSERAVDVLWCCVELPSWSYFTDVVHHTVFVLLCDFPSGNLLFHVEIVSFTSFPGIFLFR